MARYCHCCNVAEADEEFLPGTNATTSIGFCLPCLRHRRRQQGVRGLVIVVTVWLAFALYVPGILARTDINGYWQSAQILPAMIIALYITSFVFQSVWFLLRQSGLRHIGEVWAVDIAIRQRR